MKLKAGQMLQHYRLTEQIGEGGMGVVWRAVDTNLGRDVAIKVLPAAVADSRERLARFENEARVLASLNHTNIATVHGLHRAEDDDGGNPIHFLAMELVPGEDLSVKIQRRGPLPVDEALDYARQIASALAAAHRKNVVHRDLKPANVLITPENRVRVVDFGLAKALDPHSPLDTADATSLSVSPTITSGGTAAGTILGTAAYMSPEQARGDAVGRRTDLWALGCVMFEMLTAQRPFQGDTASDTMAAILKEEPDWSLLPDGVPSGTLRLMRRCLAKKPGERQRDAGDAILDLNEPDAPPRAVVESAGSSGRPAWIVAAVATLIAIGAIGWATLGVRGDRGASTSGPLADARLSVSFPPAAPMALWSLFVEGQPAFDVGPDGRRIVYSAELDGRRQLFIRHLDRFGAEPIPGTEDGVMPAFSPDGEWIAYFTRDQLMKVRADGGAATPLAPVATSQRGASFTGDGSIVYAPDSAGGLWIVGDDGSNPRPLTRLDDDAGEVSHRWPHVAPGGRKVLFTIKQASIATFDDASAGIADLPDGTHRVVMQGGSDARFVAPGSLVYGRDGHLFAVPFDLESEDLTGDPAMLPGSVLTTDTLGAVLARADRHGTIFVAPSSPTAALGIPLTWLGRDGTLEPLAAPEVNYQSVELSPDGKLLAASVTAANDDLWTYDIERDVFERVTSLPGNEISPIFSPDGRALVFSGDGRGDRDLYRLDLDQDSPPTLLLDAEHPANPNDWSRDGRWIAYDLGDPETRSDLWLLDLADPAGPTPKPFLRTNADESFPCFSPDGTQIAYVSDENGREEVYVRPVSGGRAALQVSNAGGRFPLWSPDGHELFYLTDETIMSVRIDGSHAERPRLIARGEFRYSPGFALSPDGERFLILDMSRLQFTVPALDILPKGTRSAVP